MNLAPPRTISTPITWRLAIAAGVLLLGLAAYAARAEIGLRGQSAIGVICFFGLVATFSTNLRAVNWRTIAWGIGLQLLLALLVLKVGYNRAATPQEKAMFHARQAAAIVGANAMGSFEVVPLVQMEHRETVFVRPFYAVFESLGKIVKSLISFSDKGAEFVFGNLARPGDLALKPGVEFLFIFAFKALPPILFISAFFTVLYHYGVLQWCVRMMARAMEIG